MVVTAGNVKAFTHAANMLRIGGSLCCVGIPAEKGFVETPVSIIAIKGLHITGNLVGSLKECLEAVDLDTRGIVKPTCVVRPFEDLPKIYEEMERGDIMGRIVMKMANDD